MNREEVKTILPILQAFADGKTIQYDNGSSDITDLAIGNFERNYKHYRIKPSHTYRPFKNTEECWEEMLKHQPFGWIKHKDTQQRYCIGELSNDGLLTLCTQYSCSFEDAFKRFTLLDDTPFGIKVEE